MDNAKKSVLTGMLAAGLAVILSGCSTMGGGKADEPAVMCSKCQTVWVSRPHRVGKSWATVYSRQKKMVCSDCESAAKNFFDTGKLEHTCKTCGTNLVACPLCK
jgi:hypothetical protein